MPMLNTREGRTKPISGERGKKLTAKMRSFVDAYCGPARYVGTEAYRLSLYNPSKNPAQAAYELLQHPLIQAEIQKRLTKKQEQSEVKAEYLINKLFVIIEQTEGSEKTADRLRAIELAGKAIALWKERQEISGPDGEAIKHEQHVKESVADFTAKLAALTSRNTSQDAGDGSDNVVKFPERSGTSGA